MEETKFMKMYQSVLLPLYLILCIWFFLVCVLLFGVPDATTPLMHTITIVLTGIIYIVYMALIIYLLMKFKKRTKKIYILNMILLYAFPFALEMCSIAAPIVFFNEEYDSMNLFTLPWFYSILAYAFIYAIIFVLFFLPQVIYFENRKWLFTQGTES